MKKLLLRILILFCSAILIFSCSKKPLTPETALQSYLNNSDKSFKWEIQDKHKS